MLPDASGVAGRRRGARSGRFQSFNSLCCPVRSAMYLVIFWAKTSGLTAEIKAEVPNKLEFDLK